MQPKSLTWIGILVGSTIGGFIPTLWGAGMLSMSGILFSGLGAILGIYVAFKVARTYL
jgi:predicted MFS family arabinose efflux permease